MTEPTETPTCSVSSGNDVYETQLAQAVGQGVWHEALTKRQAVQNLTNTNIATSGLEYGWSVLDLATGLAFPKTPKDENSKAAMITFSPENLPGSSQRPPKTSASMFNQIRLKLEQQGMLVTVPQGDNVTFDSCLKPPCSSFESCRPFYKCFFGSLGASEPEYDRYLYQLIDEAFQSCYAPSISNNTLIQCPIFFQNTLKANQYASPRHDTCTSDAYKPTLVNWINATTDEVLKNFTQGGLASDGIYWPGRDTQLSFAQDIGRQATKYSNMHCSLRQPCDEDLICEEVGSRTVFERGRRVYRSRPAYFILVALENINRQLSNQYNAIGDALAAIALDTWNIDDFLPAPDDGSGILGALNGLGSIFSVFSGFIPVVGPAISASGSILTGVASILGQSISKQDPLVAPKTFAPIVAALSAGLYPALEDAADTLFEGKPVNGRFDIVDMMTNGTWIEDIQKLSGLREAIKTEILSRSINALWKKETSNKRWVHFSDLGNETCENHLKGPQDSKYCADNGVYYTYNFIEDGDRLGHVDYPWGGNLLKTNLEIDLKWVTEASARTYRQARLLGLSNPFDLTNETLQQTFVNEILRNPTDLSNIAGRYPGSWTLPVCDTSTWGKFWNWDYTKEGQQYKHSHPPCLCGPNGTETDLWQRAAGMYNFKTFHLRCVRALQERHFQWPLGVDNVTYSSDHNYTVHRPGT